MGDFNAEGKPEIQVTVSLADPDTARVLRRDSETVDSENTTKGHALVNIPMLREALNARGVPVKAPDPGDDGRLL